MKITTEIKLLYECDHEKNTECNKNTCYLITPPTKIIGVAELTT